VTIGIFDSGEGGLTVARVLDRLLPGEDLVYACDTARFPYGPRPLGEVRQFLLQFLEFFALQQCRLVVIACNTATAAASDLLVDGGWPVPLIGVVGPGARAAALESKSGKIGVAATEGTCQSGIYPRLINEERSDAIVLQRACPILVIRAEEGIITGPKVRAEVIEALAPLLAGGVDTLVLGCTHFPHMRELIADVVGPRVTLIDPAVATGQMVANMLLVPGREDSGRGVRSFHTTGDPRRFVDVASRLWPGGVHAAHLLQIDTKME